MGSLFSDRSMPFSDLYARWRSLLRLDDDEANATWKDWVDAEQYRPIEDIQVLATNTELQATYRARAFLLLVHPDWKTLPLYWQDREGTRLELCRAWLIGLDPQLFGFVRSLLHAAMNFVDTDPGWRAGPRAGWTRNRYNLLLLELASVLPEDEQEIELEQFSIRVPRTWEFPRSSEFHRYGCPQIDGDLYQPWKYLMTHPHIRDRSKNAADEAMRALATADLERDRSWSGLFGFYAGFVLFQRHEAGYSPARFADQLQWLLGFPYFRRCTFIEFRNVDSILSYIDGPEYHELRHDIVRMLMIEQGNHYEATTARRVARAERWIEEFGDDEELVIRLRAAIARGPQLVVTRMAQASCERSALGMKTAAVLAKMRVSAT